MRMIRSTLRQKAFTYLSPVEMSIGLPNIALAADDIIIVLKNAFIETYKNRVSIDTTMKDA